VRPVAPYSLWLGHAGDLRDLSRLLAQGIAAVVDLALEEKPAVLTRELVYCRFPLNDGADNPPWVIRQAVLTVAQLLRARVPTLVSCGAGMSRSPAIAAAALATTSEKPLDECLAIVTSSGIGDVSQGLWKAVQEAVAR
jgi:hypothetical protein